MKKRTLFLILLVIAALGLVSCTRSASREPTAVPGTEGGDGTEGGETGDGTEGGDLGEGTPSDVIGSEFLTQTAQAESGGEATPGPDATDAPGDGDATEPAPEATEPPPEETEPPPEATDEPSTADCSSPFTVQKGDWVWDIGRRCNIHPNDIIAANNLSCYYDGAGRLQCPVYAGDKLVLPDDARPFPGP